MFRVEVNTYDSRAYSCTRLLRGQSTLALSGRRGIELARIGGIWR